MKNIPKSKSVDVASKIFLVKISTFLAMTLKIKYHDSKKP